MIEIEKNDLKEITSVIPVFAKKVDEIYINNEKNIKENKERFNVFDALTKHHLEELHTNFIAYLLNPESTHDCSTIFLECFLDTLKESEEIKSMIESASITDFSEAKVHKEHKSGGEKMDIYIHFPGKLNIVIENKIGAKEQFNQIKRYIDFCEKKEKTEKAYIVFYLTPTGWHSKTAGSKVYFPISYKEHIVKWLSACLKLKGAKEYHIVTSGINSYIDMIKKNILNLNLNKNIMQIADLLMQTENLKLIKYLNQFDNVIEEITKKCRDNFFDELGKKINAKREKGLDTYLYSVIKDEKYCLKIAENKEIEFCISDNGEDLYYGIIMNDLKSKIPRKEFVKISNLFEKNESLSFDDKYCDDPTVPIYFWKYYKISENQTYFWDPYLNYIFASNIELIVNDFIKEINLYLKEWEIIVKELSRK